MKLEQIINSLPALQKIAQQEVPIHALKKMQPGLKTADKLSREYYAKRDEVYAEYGEQVQPGTWNFREEVVDTVNAKIGELLNVEVTIPAIHLPDEIKLSYADFALLDGIAE